MRACAWRPTTPPPAGVRTSSSTRQGTSWSRSMPMRKGSSSCCSAHCARCRDTRPGTPAPPGRMGRSRPRLALRWVPPGSDREHTTSGPFAWAPRQPCIADWRQPEMMMTMTTTEPFPTERLADEDIRVLLLENIHADGRDFLRGKGFQVETVDHALGEDELVEAIKGVHLLGIRSTTYITEKVLDAAPDLLAIGAFCIGTNQID